MRTLFVIFSILLGLNAFATETKANGPDEQTKRVATDPVMWAMLHPLMKKYDVACRIALSSEESNDNPHWTCLNNMACSYTVKVGCFEKKGARKEKLEIEVDGFDDGKEPQLQDLSVSYK